MEEPTFQIVREKLLSLIDGAGSRLEIEEWAWKIVCMKPPPDMPELVWETINALAGCEERDGGPDRPYIYRRTDFENWLSRLDGEDLSQPPRH